ncbi:hypothetical protein, variant [Exophiala dermatitidis NIH/UT8656]|nr:hypothetical protein, variant [Exophiala dermatitidis NIH/UT8656]EHY53778.1 hypothetical protein, variant [Exophiala dermatitidis NIH/UT8656]
MAIEDLTPVILVFNKFTHFQLDRLIRTHGSHGLRFLTLTSGQESLRPSLGSLIFQDDAQLGCRGVDLRECRVAYDLADETAGVAERPGTLVGVAEGDVRVGTALDHDRVAHVVEDLTA